MEPLTQLFARYGRGGPAIEEDAAKGGITIRVYLPAAARVRRARLETGLSLLSLIQPLVGVEQLEVEEADWERAWRSHFTVLMIGERLVVKPSWLEYQPRARDVVIELDPGMAFGTGHHPTTRMCLVLLERWLRPGMRVLDLGTGSGILAIAAARLGASGVVAMDNDPLAVRIARSNLKAGLPEGGVRLLRGTLPDPRVGTSCFDLVVANITARVIGQKTEALWEVIRPGGVLITGGIIEGQRQGVEAALTSAGFRSLAAELEEDWVTLVAEKTT